MTERDGRYVRREAAIYAVPYDGTNIQEIELFFRGLPGVMSVEVRGSDVFDDAVVVLLNVAPAQNLGRLAHKGEWLVFDMGRLEVLWDAEFHEKYEPAGG